MQEKQTYELENILGKTHPDEYGDYIRENKDSMRAHNKTRGDDVMRILIMYATLMPVVIGGAANMVFTTYLPRH